MRRDGDRARVDPELLAQPVPQLREDLQRLPLTLEPVRRPHGEHGRPLVERVLGHQPGGDPHRLRDVVLRRAGREQGRGQVPPDPAQQLLEPHPLGHHQVVADPGVGRPPGPQRDRLPAPADVVAPLGTLGREGDEPLRIEAHVDGHDVPRVGGAHQPVAELAAQPRDDGVHGGGREVGRGVAPDQVEDDLRRDRSSAAGHQDGQHVARPLAPRGGGGLDPVPDPDRAEDTHVHEVMQPQPARSPR